MADTNEMVYHEFYTKERWNNWLKQIKESDFKIQEDASEEDMEKESAIFVNMEDDILLACLKVIAKYDNDVLSAEDAMEILKDIREIALGEIEPVSEDIDLMIESLQTSLMGAFASCECYLNGGYDKNTKIKDLIDAAVEAEEAADIPSALGYVAQVGALVLNGSSLDDSIMEELPYGIVAEWLDGIDSIGAAMVGADSYKEDDGDYDVV